MPLGPGEVYRRLGSVDINPTLSVLADIGFVFVGQSPGTYPCNVALQAHFPHELKALLASLSLGGQTARAILRRLDPHQGVPPHVDAWMPSEADWRRFQVPLVSHPDIEMRWPGDGVAVHLEPGSLYEVRFDREHEVVNDTDTARVHLQVDQVDATI